MSRIICLDTASFSPYIICMDETKVSRQALWERQARKDRERSGACSLCGKRPREINLCSCRPCLDKKAAQARRQRAGSASLKGEQDGSQ